MEIKLDRLALSNFQGIKSLNLNFNAQNTEIRGSNATGKTTIMSGFMWLLFGKNAEGKTDFQIKPIDPATKQEISGLECSVTAVLLIDGQPLELKKTLAEKWTKKRGEVQAVFTGHETTYTIDGVPSIKKEFDAVVSGIVAEDVFRLLTDPAHFNGLHWQEKRKLLMEICGDVDTKEVIESSAELRDLLEIIKGHSVDDYKKIAAAKKTEINKRLSEIPARIDEASRSISDDGDVDALAAEAKTVGEQIEAAKAGSNIAQLRADVAMAEGERQRALAAQQNAIDKARFAKEKAIREWVDKKEKAEFHLTTVSADMEKTQKEITSLRSQFSSLASKMADDKSTCPTCGQAMPEAMIQQAQEAFNLQKAAGLEQINRAGQALKTKLAELQGQKSMFEQAAKEAAAEIKKAQEIEIRTDGAENMLAGTAERLKKAQDKLALASTEAPDTSGLEVRRAELLAEIAGIEASRKNVLRVQELKDEERELAAQYEKIQQEIFLLEKFTVQKVKMLDEKINSRFELTRFKMFENQINGGIQECCTATDLDGVPVGYGLNRANCLAVGLDIIKTLSAHFGVQAPIFVDNAECAVKLPDPGTQVIRLVVDGNYKSLEIVK